MDLQFLILISPSREMCDSKMLARISGGIDLVAIASFLSVS